MGFIVAHLAPKELKEPMPRVWGMIEGVTGIDHTGFAFTPYGGNGNCRIINAKHALKTPGSKIIFGMITPPNGRSYPHLWVTENGNIYDASCRMTEPACQERKMFAVIDPSTLATEIEKPQNEAESYQLRWGLEYLSGLKKVTTD